MSGSRPSSPPFVAADAWSALFLPSFALNVFLVAAAAVGGAVVTRCALVALVVVLGSAVVELFAWFVVFGVVQLGLLGAGVILEAANEGVLALGARAGPAPR